MARFGFHRWHLSETPHYVQDAVDREWIVDSMQSWKTTAVVSAILQSASLAGFILISAHVSGAIGKQIIVALTIIGLLMLLYSRVRNSQDLILVSLLMALEWPLIFHLLGWVAFPGLLHDLQVSQSYAMACLRSAAAIFALGFAASGLCLTCRCLIRVGHF